MNVIFLSPHFPRHFYLFCARLKERGVHVLGIGDCPYEQIGDNCRYALTDYRYVPSLADYDAVYRTAAAYISRYGRIDYVESENEYWLELEARLRKDFNIATGPWPEVLADMNRKSRMATRGNMDYENYHLFVMRDNRDRTWTLAHNGTIFDCSMLDRYFYTQEGKTDSERILCHIIAAVNARQNRLNRPLNAAERFELMDELVCQIQHTLASLPEPELLWPFSNPPYIYNEADIPVAQFTGVLTGKTNYREYLSDRYGRYKMTLSGIHVNYSFSDELLKADFAIDGGTNFTEYKRLACCWRYKKMLPRAMIFLSRIC